MGLFNFGSSGGANANGEVGSGDSIYSNDEMLGVYKDLTYIECRDIYRYWALGKRIATALPNFAMSAPRDFYCGEHPAEVADEFKDTADKLNIDRTIKKASIYARVFGLSSIFIACDSDEKNPSDPLTYGDINDCGISFNVLDPLSMGASIQIDNNPLSHTFQQPINVTVGGANVHTQRICTIYNDIPLYLKFNPSSYSFSGASIYQNMTLLIRSWNRCIIALQRLATKAGAMVKTSREVAHANGVSLQAIQKNLEMIRNMENDGIASIQTGEEINFFSLTGASEVDAIIQQLNTGLMMALSDTPSRILLDKNLSVGLNDGSEDMKAILMAVEHFREQMLKPLYNFVDKFIMYKAWSQPFIERMRREYPEHYEGMSDIMIFQQWKQDFKFEFGDLYPQTENDRIESAKTRLDMLTTLKEMGATDEDIETALNQNPIFDGIDFTLNKSGDEMEDDVNMDDWGSEIEYAEKADELENKLAQAQAQAQETTNEENDKEGDK